MAYSLPYNLNECSCKCVTAPAINSAITGKIAVKGVAFSYTITGTYKPTSYNATGLPAGLGINTANGVISGTPTTVGVSTITITATNAGGTGTATFTLTVNPPTPVITSAVSASGTATAAFSYGIAASNSPTSYNATGLPAGLGVNTANGVISGTPTTAGTFNVTIYAANVTGTGAATLTITIAEAPVLANWLRIALTWGRPGNIVSYLYINELNASAGIDRHPILYLCDFTYSHWDNAYVRYNSMYNGEYGDQNGSSRATLGGAGSDYYLDAGTTGKIVYDINLNEYKKLGKPWLHTQIQGAWYYLMYQAGFYYPTTWPTVYVTATYYDRDPIRTFARTSYDYYGRPYQNDYRADDPAAKIALPGKQVSGGCNRFGSYLFTPSCSSDLYHNTGKGPYATYVMSPLHVATSGNIMVAVDLSNNTIYIY